MLAKGEHWCHFDAFMFFPKWLEFGIIILLKDPIWIRAPKQMWCRRYDNLLMNGDHHLVIKILIEEIYLPNYRTGYAPPFVDAWLFFLQVETIISSTPFFLMSPVGMWSHLKKEHSSNPYHYLLLPFQNIFLDDDKKAEVWRLGSHSWILPDSIII